VLLCANSYHQAYHRTLYGIQFRLVFMTTLNNLIHIIII